MSLTLSWPGPLSYRNQSIDLQSKSMDWFLYDNGPRHERVNRLLDIYIFENLFFKDLVLFGWYCSSSYTQDACKIWLFRVFSLMI